MNAMAGETAADLKPLGEVVASAARNGAVGSC